MDFNKVPFGFGAALSRNQMALNAYSAMGEEEKRTILDLVENARSDDDVHRIVSSLARNQAL